MTVEPPSNDMTWDGENRMTAFQGLGGAASYSYDGNGMRIEKSVSGGTTTVSIFSGSQVIAEYDNGAAPSSPSREYIYNPAGGATTGLLAMISNGTTTYFHQDDQSVRLTTDANGNVLSQQGTFPFGEQWYQSGSGNEWVFTNYDRDSESGLDYALARYYDSRTGTFCSADPLAGDPSDPQSWNRYAYGRNDPIDITDPSGKSWWSDLLIGVGVAAAIYFAPEIAGFFGGSSGGGIWGSTTVSVLGQSSTTYFGTSILSTSIGLGITAGGMAAMASNPPQMPQMPPTPQARFIHCNNQYGTPNSQGNLTYQGYQDAAQAAQSAHIPVSNELALWDNENALSLTTKVPVGPSGEIGPMQLTPPAYNTLSNLGQLPSGWNNPANPEANLLAGARYFAHILKSQPLSNAAAVYNGGTGGMNTNAAQNYQKNFNSKNAQFQKMVNCMH
jgi:RHS repeat-associated protein